MFTDSKTAARFSCGYDKTRYLVNFGLQKYCKSLLVDSVMNAPLPYFTILFDESLNPNLNKKQLDFHIRFWHMDKVATRYFHSEFLGKSRSMDL